MKKLPVGIACGGTGGHVFPALAVAEALRDMGEEVVFFLSGHNFERFSGEVERAGFRYIAVSSQPLPNSFGKKLTFVFRFISAIRKCKKVLKETPCCSILGMGSFICAPVCLAATREKIPLFLHEGNSIIGKANRMLSWRAQKLALSLPPVSKQKLHCQMELTGFPLRHKFLEAASTQKFDKNAILLNRGLKLNLPVLLFFAGSQGSESLNQAFAEAVAELGELNQRFQLVQMTGQKDNSEKEGFYAQLGLYAKLLEFETNMPEVYSIADFAVCRAGAATLTELAIMQVSNVLLVPLPWAADDHQSANAKQFSFGRNATVLKQQELSPALLREKISDWLLGKEKKTINEKTKMPVDFDSAQKIAKMLLSARKD